MQLRYHNIISDQRNLLEFISKEIHGFISKKIICDIDVCTSIKNLRYKPKVSLVHTF